MVLLSLFAGLAFGQVRQAFQYGSDEAYKAELRHERQSPTDPHKIEISDEVLAIRVQSTAGDPRYLFLLYAA